MITLNLMGGLGNQLFIWAFGQALVHRGYEVQYDVSRLQPGNGRIYLLDKLGLTLPIGEAKSSHIVYEKGLRFNAEYLTPPKDCTMHGFFQCEKYWEGIEDQIRGAIFEGVQLSPLTRKVASLIYEAGARSCFVHIRRTDNLRTDGLRVHGLLPMEYFARAVGYMASLVPNAQFFVFSDDSEWILNEAGVALFQWGKKDYRIVFHNAPSFTVDETHNLHDKPGGTEHEDLWLMSLCRNAIIANSTFSWWGAWLQRRNSAIIAPKNWFATSELDATDIVPERWLKL